MKKIVSLLLLAAAVAGGLFWWASTHKKEEIKILASAEIRQGTVRKVLEETGIIKSQVGAIVKIGARATGTIERMLVKVGDQVKKGELVAVIDSRELRSQEEESEAQLASARAELERVRQVYPLQLRETEAQLAQAQALADYLSNNYQRQQKLLASGVISQDDLENASQKARVQADQVTALKATLERLRHEFRQQERKAVLAVSNAKATLKAIRIRISYTRIESPISGIVSDVTAQEGETIVAGLQVANLITVLDPTRLEMWVYVDETDVGQVHHGTKGGISGRRLSGQNVQRNHRHHLSRTGDPRQYRLLPSPGRCRQRTGDLSAAGDDHTGADHRGREGQRAEDPQYRSQVGRWSAGGLRPGERRNGAAGGPATGAGRYHRQRGRSGAESRGSGGHPGEPAAEYGAEGRAVTGGDAVIRLENVVKSYRQADLTVEVLKGISLEIAEGEFVALLGPSGSGKSTLMHILGLLDRATSGRYVLQGQDVAGHSDDGLSELRNRTIGFIFQTFYLIPYATALENVMLPGLYSRTSGRRLRHRAEELLVQVGLGDRMDFKPSQLSGGQQQRVALARSLINDPTILLADEPTGQLDSATSSDIMKLIAGIHDQGRTVILVTHEKETADYAQREVYLHDGRVQDR